VLLQGFTPVPTGEPVSTVIVGVIAAIGSLFRLFRGGVSGPVKTALEGIRGTIATVADNLTRYAWTIARALGKVLSALHTIWTRVIWPMLRQLPRLVSRVRRLIERDLPRLLDYIDRIRRWVLDWYERIFRPLLLVIQRMRRMILILRLLHIHWGDKLDAQLARLQERVMYPIRVVLEHLAVVEQWINAIVTAEQLLEETLFHNSVWHYQGALIRTWWAGMTTGEGRAALLAAQARQSDLPAAQSRADIQVFLRTGAGPLAERARQSAAELWGQIGRR
jgi:hypothetical protein